jgi:hypothetical protein
MSQNSALENTDFLRMPPLEACLKDRPQQASSRNYNLFADHDQILSKSQNFCAVNWTKRLHEDSSWKTRYVLYHEDKYMDFSVMRML